MSQTKNLLAKSSTLGDSAVDGLFGGLGAGFVMALYFVTAGLITGDNPTIVLSRFDSSAAASPLTGALTHLAVAGVYGMIFGIGCRYLRWDRLPLWLAGLVYGLVLLVLAETVVLPSARPALLAIPLWSFSLAHVIYGLMVGWLIDRVKANSI